MPDADNKKKRPEHAVLAAIAEVERVIEETRRHALKLFSQRRVVDGGTLNEWLTSEPEDCWPASCWVERDAEYELKIALPGFDPRKVELTGMPQQLVIEARGKTPDSREPAGERGVAGTVCNRRLRRHVDLPVDFRANTARATLHDGVLTIVAPKVGAAAASKETAGKWRIDFPR